MRNSLGLKVWVPGFSSSSRISTGEGLRVSPLVERGVCVVEAVLHSILCENIHGSGVVGWLVGIAGAGGKTPQGSPCIASASSPISALVLLGHLG